jgi:hypothetical protein
LYFELTSATCGGILKPFDLVKEHLNGSWDEALDLNPQKKYFKKNDNDNCEQKIRL